jgi:hypothetical protein
MAKADVRTFDREEEGPMSGLRALKKEPKPPENNLKVYTINPKHYKLWVTEATGKPYWVLWSGDDITTSEFKEAYQQAQRYSRCQLNGYDPVSQLSKVIHLPQSLHKAA